MYLAPHVKSLYAIKTNLPQKHTVEFSERANAQRALETKISISAAWSRLR
jgi:hypothetical protein